VKKVIILNKKEGETPLEALEYFRKKNREYENTPMTYAGRLDPMASGVLLILVGEETKKKEKYLAFDKEYDFEVLFGFATDTYDILGKATNTPLRRKRLRSGVDGVVLKKELEEKIRENLKYFTGGFTQKYPIYSSKTVKGKALFQYARSGEKIKLPSREVFVKELRLLKLKKINNKKLFENIERRIKKVKGDFRQKETLEIWHKKLLGENTQKQKQKDFFIASFKIKCSSGTYMRVIANSLGEKMNMGALAFSIKRTKVGRYTL